MKIKEAIEALYEGKRIGRIPSDPPVDLCDHLSHRNFERGVKGYYQLCHQDKVIRVVPDTSCAGTVERVMDLEEFQVANSFLYINFRFV